MQKQQIKAGIPVLWGILEDGKVTTEKCFYCGHIHHHGGSEGPRVAHCKPYKSPWRKRGRYWEPQEQCFQVTIKNKIFDSCVDGYYILISNTNKIITSK